MSTCIDRNSIAVVKHTVVRKLDQEHQGIIYQTFVLAGIKPKKCNNVHAEVNLIGKEIPIWFCAVVSRVVSTDGLRVSRALIVALLSPGAMKKNGGRLFSADCGVVTSFTHVPDSGAGASMVIFTSTRSWPFTDVTSAPFCS